MIDLALSVCILTSLILFGLQFPHSPRLEELWLTVQLRHYGEPPIAQVGSLFDLIWPSPGSVSLLPLGLAFGIWIAKIAVDAVLLRSYRTLSKMMPAPQLAGAGDVSLGVGDLGLGLDASSAESEKEREELLKRYREIEKQLKGSKRKRCTFLSIDVVGSTQMKIGERETEIAATFQAYEEMLRKIFEQHAAWKQAWTPDGVMICFLQPGLALAAAQRILQSLKKFNESDNKLRTPFSVRCGMNEGEVPIYEDSKLEKVADHVIDVAGHMQKQGKVDTIWLGEETYNLLSDKSGFHPTDQVVDGFKVYEWSADSTGASTGAAAGAAAS